MIPGSANPLLLGSSAGAAPIRQIERSLRFNSVDSAYLSRTPSVGSNRRTWTFSAWIKRTGLSDQAILSTMVGGFNGFVLQFSSNSLFAGDFGSSSYAWQLQTTALFRDPSAWYHVLLSVNTTQSVAADRVKLYVNGAQETSFSLSSLPFQNYSTQVNIASQQHAIGRLGTSNVRLFDGYLADIYFIDGQALAPSNFGRFDTEGVWQPIDYAGTYGTNGFHLPFSDNSTAAALGTDTSGNGNDWTVNNISAAAGVNNDSLVDTPTNYGTDTGAGGEVRGNYCTWNPLDKGSSLALIKGNLTTGSITTTWGTVRGTIGIGSGKYYWEITYTAAVSNPNVMIGIGNSSMPLTTYVGNTATGRAYYSINGARYPGGAGYGASYTQGDVIGVALDMDAGTLTFYKNGVSQGQSHSGLTGIWFPALSTYGAVNTALNAGARPFIYPAPSGYKALCTANLSDPQAVITSGSYAGNGAADGPFVYLNGVPTAITVNGNAVTFGTDADGLSNGFKIRTNSTTYNQNAVTYNYSITSIGDPFKTARAQSNP